MAARESSNKDQSGRLGVVLARVGAVWARKAYEIAPQLRPTARKATTKAGRRKNSGTRAARTGQGSRDVEEIDDVSVYSQRVNGAITAYEAALQVPLEERPWGDEWWEVDTSSELIRILFDFTSEYDRAEERIQQVLHLLQRMPYSERLQACRFQCLSYSIAVLRRRANIGAAHAQALDALTQAKRCGAAFSSWQVHFAMLASATAGQAPKAIGILRTMHDALASNESSSILVLAMLRLALIQQCIEIGGPYLEQATKLVSQMISSSDDAAEPVPLPASIRAMLYTLAVFVYYQRDRTEEARTHLLQLHAAIDELDRAEHPQEMTSLPILWQTNNGEEFVFTISLPSVNELVALAFLVSGTLHLSDIRGEPNKAAAFYEAGISLCSDVLGVASDEAEVPCAGVWQLNSTRNSLIRLWIATLIRSAALQTTCGRLANARERLEKAVMMAKEIGGRTWRDLCPEFSLVWAIVCHAEGALEEAEQTYLLVIELANSASIQEIKAEIDGDQSTHSSLQSYQKDYQFLAKAGLASLHISRQRYDVVPNILTTLAEAEHHLGEESKLILLILETALEMALSRVEGSLKLKQRLRQALMIANTLDHVYLKAWIYAALGDVYKLDEPVQIEIDSLSPSKQISESQSGGRIAMKMWTTAYSLSAPSDSSSHTKIGSHPIAHWSASALAANLQKIDLTLAAQYTEAGLSLRRSLEENRLREQHEKRSIEYAHR